MRLKQLGMALILMALALVFLLQPEVVWANVGGIGADALSQRVTGLTNKIVTVILPAVAVLGLVYAAILAATGDQSAKPRMMLIIFASLIGFLAPVIIRWLQSAAGSGGLF